MAKTPEVKRFQAGKGYSEADWSAVDFPEMTDQELETARPATEILPAEFFKAMEEQRKSRGRPALESPKKQVTLRLDEDVIARFRQSGKGWQGRMNEALRKAVGL
ncbi:BrnA antitoxin family protein [Agrobacterium sp. rho-13.3]|uniref:BrnA antitoxin family protein n=1 Tax=Agrobacterium sp. rho-13.3 TaxID=3072980 RepID=UPI002A180AA8|nr:BrnA antitoxin family protein [Agrobacterium sp. rho-13.3]MDX8308610.1 BrnA antitoxin family protein [Agrobacterium sp. rho-13.3]